MKASRDMFLTACTLVLLGGCASTGAARPDVRSIWALHATPLDRSAAQLDNDVHKHLAWAASYRTRILDVQGRRTIENTLVPYNHMMMHLDAARNDCALFARVHPNPRVQRVAQDREQAVLEYLAELKLDPELYGAFHALDASRADEPTRYFVDKLLQDFRRAGADKDGPTRARIAALQREIAEIGRTFIDNIREDKREIILGSPAQLEGVPADWIARYSQGQDGKIHIRPDYADYVAFMAHAHDPETRKKVYKEFTDRGLPENAEVLERLLIKRHELAQLFGFDTWADYISEEILETSAADAQAFLNRIGQLSHKATARDYDTLLERKRRDVPGATTIETWEERYYERLEKNERLAFDPQSARVYFDYSDVLQGLFDLTERLFDIRYERVHGLNLWHESVTAWDVYDNAKRIGRFYLDMHPRKGKHGRAAHFPYRTGVASLRLPQAVLVCNLPDPRKSRDGTALLNHSDVVILFREFGHLLHTLFAGHDRWIGDTRLSMEPAVVELSARVLEELCYKPSVLQSFAKHFETREPIPPEIADGLRRADAFGRGMRVDQQLVYAGMLFDCCGRDSNDLDIAQLSITLQGRHSPVTYAGDTDSDYPFGHLVSYSGTYYTRLFSTVVAEDLLTAFEQSGKLNMKVGRRFRKKVLEPGSFKPAQELIEDFLGRPCSFDAFEAWLNGS